MRRETRRAEQASRRPLGEGASQGAPTAPHATPRAKGATRTGPERFWARGPVRVALGVCAALSTVVHGMAVPIGIPHALVVHDDDQGEAAIPIDFLGPENEESPPPPPPPQPTEEAPPTAGAAPGSRADAPRPIDAVDAGEAARRDAAADASADAMADGAPDAAARDGAVADGGVDGAVRDGQAPEPDAGGGGRSDPEEIMASESLRADVVLVRLQINVDLIRSHPVGAHLGFLLRGIPQWDDFLRGTEIDPLRDADWILISGPSLIDTARDSVLIRYSAPDAVVDRALRVVSARYEHGGAFDAGVRGLKATLAHADRADRVIFRPQPRLLAVVPPSTATRYARVLQSARIPEHPRPKDAVYLRLANPHHKIPEIPETVTEVELRVLPRADGGAEVLLDGQTKDVETAAAAADAVRRAVRRHNDTFTSLLTHGLLDHVEVTSDGAVVRARLAPTRDQIETVVGLVSGFLGLPAPDFSSDPAQPHPAPPTSGATSPSPAAPRVLSPGAPRTAPSR